MFAVLTLLLAGPAAAATIVSDGDGDTVRELDGGQRGLSVWLALMQQRRPFASPLVAGFEGFALTESPNAEVAVASLMTSRIQARIFGRIAGTSLVSFQDF